MAAVGAPQSLAESLGVEWDTKVTYTTACCLVAGLAKTQKLSAPEVFDRAVGATNLLDLPMKQFDSRASKVVHMVDVIKDYEGDIDKEAVKDLMLQNNLADLPAPLCPKAECVIPFTMDVCLIPAPDGKLDVYKHFVFDSPIKVSLAKELMHGETLLIDWGANQKAGPKAFLYLWHRLGGFQVNHWTFQKEDTEKSTKTPNDIDAAYDLMATAPTTHKNNMQARWIMKEINDPESPLYRWLKTDIREGISNLRSSQITAETEEHYPIYFSDLAPWWQKVALEHVVPYLLSNSVLMLGKAGDGKTPSNMILGFAMSRYHGDRLGMENFAGQVRTGSNFDYFRLESGVVQRPDIFDDGDIDKQDPSKMKAFLDPSQKSAKTKERWGAAEFVRNQLRLAADNKCDFSAEPTLEDLGFNSGAVPYAAFLDMIKPAFPKDILQGDIEAMIKRAVVVVSTETKCYVRPPSKMRDAPIHLFWKGEAWDELFISSKASHVLTTWLKTGASVRTDAEKQVLMEQERQVFKGILDTVIKKPEPEDEKFIPEFARARAPATVKAVKVEPSGKPFAAWQLKKDTLKKNAIISLDSPSPLKRQRVAAGSGASSSTASAANKAPFNPAEYGEVKKVDEDKLAEDNKQVKVELEDAKGAKQATGFTLSQQLSQSIGHWLFLEEEQEQEEEKEAEEEVDHFGHGFGID